MRRSLLAAPGWGHDHSSRSTRTYFDTFDWRCFRAGGFLEHSAAIDGSSLSWFDLASGEARFRQQAAGEPRFLSEVPLGRLRDHREVLIGVRALIPVVVVHVEREVVRRLDDERKTVVRVAFEQSLVETGDGVESIGWRARVEPVLGYQRAADNAAQVLGVLGLVAASRDAVLDALDRAGAEPGSYSSKLKIAIPPHATAFDAYVQVLRTLLQKVELNRPGAIADLDVEFLHDLRMAVRRARSVLRTADEVLPPSMIDDLSGRLRWLQQVTGWARDLDVWVLGFDRRAETFPAESRASLEPLRAYLEKERVAEGLVDPFWPGSPETKGAGS